jgi:hypothetical protein
MKLLFLKDVSNMQVFSFSLGVCFVFGLIHVVGPGDQF